MGRFLRAIWLIVFGLALVAQAGWLAVQQLRPDSAMRALFAVALTLPADQQLLPIPCSRAPIVDGFEKTILMGTLNVLAQPARRAAVFCLLGDYPAALAAYQQAASAGDDVAALQVYFLQARQGNMAAAGEALGEVNFPKRDLRYFFYDVVALKLNIDGLPVAERIVDLYPGDPDSWQLWLAAARNDEAASNWPAALDAYLQALRVQDELGVRIGRSSFEQAAGLIYQSHLVPRDPASALICYNRAIADMDFLGGASPAYVFLYRGEVYQALGKAYTPAQALQEFQRALALDPKNYWAMDAIAGVYLTNYKDYQKANTYAGRAIAVNPAYPYAYLLLGDIARAQGDLPAAIAAYQDALSRQPGYQPALDRIAAVQAQIKKQAK